MTIRSISIGAFSKLQPDDCIDFKIIIRQHNFKFIEIQPKMLI